MLVAFGPGSTIVPRLWSVSTGQGTAPAVPVSLKIRGLDHCWWTLCSRTGQELVGFKVLGLFPSGNFSPTIKSHLGTTMATSACVVVNIVSFQGNLGKTPVIPPSDWTVWLHLPSVGFKPSRLGVVGFCHTVMAGLILCWTTLFLSIY